MITLITLITLGTSILIGNGTSPTPIPPSVSPTPHPTPVPPEPPSDACLAAVDKNCPNLAGKGEECDECLIKNKQETTQYKECHMYPFKDLESFYCDSD